MRRKDKEKIKIIESVVSAYFGVTVQQALFDKRLEDNKTARHFIRYFIKTFTMYGWSDISRIYEEKPRWNHASIIHSYNRISDLIRIDAWYKEMYEDLYERITQAFSTRNNVNLRYNIKRNMRGLTKDYRRHKNVA